VLPTNIFNVKQTATMDDEKSATVFQSEPTARGEKCWLIVSAELKDMRCSELLMTSCLGNLRWMDGYR
jgi:hypothetical protein